LQRDSLVIGAVMVGLSAAAYAAQNGARVVVERAMHVGGDSLSSFASANGFRSDRIAASIRAYKDALMQELCG